LRYFGFFLTNFADWKNIPHPIAKLTRRRVRAVRRISLLPVLGRVPKERIVKALPDVRKCGRYQHYYWPELRVTSRGEPDVIKSSTEMLVLDGITSLVEYRAELEAALKTVEVEAAVIVDPHTSHI